jgi:hypothetical protein
MLLLAVLLLVGGLAGVVAGSARFLSAGWRWLWVCAGVVAGSGGLAALRWDAKSSANDVFAVMGAGIMVCSLVCLVRWGVSAWKRRDHRARGVIGAGALSALVALCGWCVHVGWDAKQSGWWLLLPRPVRIEAVPWLPEGGLSSIWPAVELSSWEKWRLESILERRVREGRDFWSLEDYLRLGGAESDELTGLVFEAMVVRFCDVANDPPVGQAWGLGHFLPIQVKDDKLALSRERAVSIMKGRVPRLIELSRRSDRGVNLTAVEMLCLCGPEAKEALPKLWEIVGSGDNDDAPYPAAVGTLRYLLKEEPSFLAEVLSRCESEDRDERVMAIWSLALPRWEHPQVIAVLEQLLVHEDLATREAAARALRRLRPELSWGSYLPSNQLRAM